MPRARSTARSARSTSARRTAARSPASPRSASTPRRTGSPTRRASCSGNLVYAYAAMRALVAWKPARFEVRARRRRARVRGLHGRRRQHAPTTAAACGSRRTPTRPTALLEVVFVEAQLEAALPRLTCRRCSRASTSSSTRSRLTAPARSRSRRDRPFDVYADGESVTTLPATVAAGTRRAARDRAARLRRSRCSRPAVTIARAAGRCLAAQPAGRRHEPARARCCCGSSRSAIAVLARSSSAAPWSSAPPTARRPPPA